MQNICGEVRIKCEKLYLGIINTGVDLVTLLFNDYVDDYPRIQVDDAIIQVLYHVFESFDVINLSALF